MKASAEQQKQILEILFRDSGFGELSSREAASFILNRRFIAAHWRLLRAKDWATELSLVHGEITGYSFHLPRKFVYDVTSQQPIMENALRSGQLVLVEDVQCRHCYGDDVGVCYDVLFASPDLPKEEILEEFDVRKCRPGSPFESFELMRHITGGASHCPFISTHGRHSFVIRRDFEAEKKRTGTGRVVRVSRFDHTKWLEGAHEINTHVGYVGIRL